MKESDDGQPEPSQRLTSWKEIADHLGVSTRTAQQYEKDRGLPIQRMGKRVAIFKSDLQKWQRDSFTTAAIATPAPVPTRKFLWKPVAAGILLLAGIAFGTYAWLFKPGPPVTLHWEGSVATAVDAKGRAVWQRQFPYPLMDLNTSAVELFAPVFGDLDKDGQVETVFPYYHNRRESEGWDLYCISSTGEVRWRLAPSRIVSNASRSFSPPYVLRGFVVFPSPEKDGTHWTAAVFVHHLEYPSVLLMVDGKGKPRGEYWHAGHLNALRTLDLNGDGIVELLAAGVQHGADQAALVVLDPRDVHGAAELTPLDDPRQFRDMEKGTEKAVVYFPRTEINRRLSQFNFILNLDIVAGLIQASVYEHITAPAGYLIYTLKPNLELKDLTISMAYLDALKKDGKHQAATAVATQAEIEKLKKEIRVLHR